MPWAPRRAIIQRMTGAPSRLTLSLCLIVPGLVVGAEPQPSLEPVVVTATRREEPAHAVPVSADVLDGVTIRRAQPAAQLSEALERMPGVLVRDRQNQAQDLQISIRGQGSRASFGVRGLRIYSDGIPASMPDGQGQVSHFLLDAVERIEVLRGPFSTLYGNASGGVIALFSVDPADTGIELGSVAGSDGLWRHRLGARWAKANGAGGMRFDAIDARGDGFRDHSAARREQAQALWSSDFGGNGRLKLLANRLDLVADDPQGLTANELGSNRRAASPGALNFDTRKTLQQDQIGAKLHYDFGEVHLLEASLWRGQRDTDQVLSVPVAVQRSNPLHGGGVIDLARDYHGVDLRWSRRELWRDAPLALTLGAQQEVADEHRRGFENFIDETLGVVGALRRDEDNRVRGRDVYAQLDWDTGSRWRLHAGLRRSQVDFLSSDRYIAETNPDDSGRIEFARASPAFGALWRMNPQTNFYVNAGAGFETPTFAELAYRSDGGSGFNPLRPARSRNVELGLRTRQATWSLDAAVFQNRSRDELVTLSNQGGRSVFGNATETRRRGFELSLQGRLSERWRWQSAFTWLDARYRGDVCVPAPCTTEQEPRIVDGRWLPGLPRRVLWSELRWSPSVETDVILDARMLDEVHADDRNQAKAAGYASFDLAAERRFRWLGAQWRGFVRLNNVLNRHYVGSVIVNEGNGRYFEPAPGRHWLAGLSMEWGRD